MNNRVSNSNMDDSKDYLDDCQRTLKFIKHMRTIIGALSLKIRQPDQTGHNITQRKEFIVVSYKIINGDKIKVGQSNGYKHLDTVLMFIPNRLMTQGRPFMQEQSDDERDYTIQVRCIWQKKKNEEFKRKDTLLTEISIRDPYFKNTWPEMKNCIKKKKYTKKK